jgi:hypothetical protein
VGVARQGIAARMTLSTVVASLLLVLGVPAAASSESPEDPEQAKEAPKRCGGADARTGRVGVCPGNGEEGRDGGGEGNTRRVGDDWTPPEGWVLSDWRTGSSEDDGTPCIRRHREWMPQEDHEARIGLRNANFFRWYERLTWDGDTVDDCEDQPEDPGLPPQLVLEVIETRLPFPEPNIEPGWALTGMPAYLEVGAPATFTDTVDGDALPVTIEFEATATYRVDWGDGHASEHASAGGPWPEGDIVHTYADAVDRTVVVTPVWSVTASGAGQTFTFPEVELVSSEFELPIREMQSVRTTGR